MKTRHYPNEDIARKVERADVPGAVVYVYEIPNDRGETLIAAYGWRSEKQTNFDFHNKYRNEADRALTIDNWFAALARSADIKQKNKDAIKKASKQPNPFTVDSVLVRTWGYEQTNNDFYKVVEVKAKSVVVVKIGKEVVDDDAQRVGHGSMATYVVARRDKVVGGPMTKVVKFSANGEARAGDMVLWDGKKMYESSYA